MRVGSRETIETVADCCACISRPTILTNLTNLNEKRTSHIFEPGKHFPVKPVWHIGAHDEYISTFMTLPTNVALERINNKSARKKLLRARESLKISPMTEWQNNGTTKRSARSKEKVNTYVLDDAIKSCTRAALPHVVHAVGGRNRKTVVRQLAGETW